MFWGLFLLLIGLYYIGYNAYSISKTYKTDTTTEMVFHALSLSFGVYLAYWGMQDMRTPAQTAVVGAMRHMRRR
jgi:hypothetical protein